MSDKSFSGRSRTEDGVISIEVRRRADGRFSPYPSGTRRIFRAPSRSTLRRQFEAAQASVGSARERLADYEIRAPFAGRLGLRYISIGTLIQPGNEVVLLDAIDPIDFHVSVPERYLGAIAVGAVVEATSPAFTEERFAGEVRSIASRVDPALRTVLLEAQIPNRDARRNGWRSRSTSGWPTGSRSAPVSATTSASSSRGRRTWSRGR